MFRRSLLIASLLSAYITSAQADDLLLTHDAKWLVIASSDTLNEVQGIAQDYSVINSRRIVRARNGRYTLIAGPFVNYDLAHAKAKQLVKKDAYLATGRTLLETVMIIDQVKTPSPLAQPAPQAPQASTLNLKLDFCKSLSADAARLPCYDMAVGRPVSAVPTPTAQPAPASVVQVPQPPKPAPSVTEVATPISEPVVPVKLQDAVKPISLKLQARRKNFEEDVFSDRIEFRVSFHNGWNAGIAGISHRFRIMNAFGDVLLQGKDNLDIQIPAGQTRESSLYYYWDDNPFISGEVYDRLLGAVTNGTYKVEMTVDKLILSDGNVLEITNPS